MKPGETLGKLQGNFKKTYLSKNVPEGFYNKILSNPYLYKKDRKLSKNE